MFSTVREVVLTYLWRIISLLFPMRFWINRVNPSNLQADFWAGLTGAVMVLPQGIAFALIAGLPPEFGLYSAIVVQLLAGFFGSSWHMVTGPTVALSIVIPSIVAPYAVIGSPQYIGMTLTLMFIVGIIQLGFGIFRLGGLVNFISHTVIIGFTAGAGTLIISSQLPTILGITLPRGLSFFEKWTIIFEKSAVFHTPSMIIAAVTVITAIWVRRYRRKWPHMLLGLMAGMLAGLILKAPENGVEMLGALPASMPQMVFPDINFYLFSELLPSAFALALLGLIEAVSIARSISVRSHQRIDGNQEFFGQGLANMVGSCFSCYVGSGSFSRSALNYDSGAKTPLSLLATSLIVILVLLFIPKVTHYLPLPAMAGAIILAGYNLFDFKHIGLIAKTSRNELTIITVTFLSTLLLDLEFAIYAGVILSLILYLQKTSHPKVTLVDFSSVYELEGEEKQTDVHRNPPVTVIRLDGSLFFGAVDHVQTRLAELSTNQRWLNVVILAEGVNIIDIAGIEALLNERNKLQKRGGDLYIIGLKTHVRNKLRKSPYWQRLGGKKHLHESTYIAFREICKDLEIDNYRQYMKHLFKDYNKL
ncbi:SulP family inorganic anion transporter [Suttonella sp. R2A3]|uniref:SulP family inorganic anion transporter n=1 Tax=Suttonella sp. R2A3 TaxID=2908648 RepID=UPI001F3896F7|nr:SulP family inorganic anion transporter [Suttonella sp. R2A3]UJF24848.1 SulP family inorganic anion transporter [Suttonella sp. R2A3]